MFTKQNNINIICYICDFEMNINLNLYNSKTINCKNCNLKININDCTKIKKKNDKKNYNKDDYILYGYEKDLVLAKSISEKQNNNHTDDKICVICFDKKIDTAFIPCGHMCSCYQCASNCNLKCPVCRKENKTIQKIFFN